MSRAEYVGREFWKLAQTVRALGDLILGENQVGADGLNDLSEHRDLTLNNLMGGLFWAGVGLAQFNLLIRLSPSDKTPVYVAVMSAVSAIALFFLFACLLPFGVLIAWYYAAEAPTAQPARPPAENLTVIVDDPRLRRAGRGAFLRRGFLRRDGRLVPEPPRARHRCRGPRARPRTSSGRGRWGRKRSHPVLRR